MKKIILNIIILLAAIFLCTTAYAVTITVSGKIPINPDAIRSALAEKDSRFNTFDAEILIYSYSTGKSVYRLTKKGELDVKDETGEIEALIKFKGGSNKPLFIKGKGLDSASLSASIAEEVTKALTPFLP
jgi:hypothetical protein